MTALPRPRVVALRPRSALAIGLVSIAGFFVFLWPLFVAPTAAIAKRTDAPLIFAAILPLLLAVVLFEISEGGLDVKAIAMLGVLSAIGAALRPLGAGTAGIETVFFLLVLAGRVFGAGFGFMLAAAWVGLGAGLLPRAKGRAELALLAAYGVFAGLLYGFVMNMYFWPFATGLDSDLSFVAGAPVLENLHRFFVFSLATSLGWDLGRAITNVALILITGRAVLLTLRRAARKAAFDAPVTFEPAQPDAAKPDAAGAALS